MRIMKAVLLLVFLVYLGEFAGVVAEQQTLMYNTVLARQIAVEERMNRLEQRSVEIADRVNETTSRLDKLEAIGMPASLAKIQTTIDYDHALMWFVCISCLVLLVERVGTILFLSKHSSSRRTD